jgi:carbamate kinase
LSARVCCGPRCGAEIGQRGIYATIERALDGTKIGVAPTQCQGRCGGGVTVVFGETIKTIEKVRDRDEASALAKRILAEQVHVDKNRFEECE